MAVSEYEASHAIRKNQKPVVRPSCSLLRSEPSALIVTVSKVLEERGVDIFQVDFDHYETLVSAFTGVFGVYAVTDCESSIRIRCMPCQLMRFSLRVRSR